MAALTSSPRLPPGAPLGRLTAGHVLVPLGAATCALPGIPTWAALLGGMGAALVAGNPYAGFTRRVTHRLLVASVIGLGAAMDLRVVARVGAHGLAYTAVGIATALGLGMTLARLLRVSSVVGLLISVGTAICGGSAIAAIVPVLGAKEEEASVALGTVFLLNAVALLLFPPLGHALHLTQDQFGLWSALAIHDTSSVVGAGMLYGPRALEVATTVKLARALWIVPVSLAVGWLHARRTPGVSSGPVRKPWFILGFVLAAAAVTFVPELQPAGAIVGRVARQGLVITLFLIGVSLTPNTLRAVGPRPMAQGVLLWMSVASLTLGAILVGVIA